jgi:hypothetical protein
MWRGLCVAFALAIAGCATAPPRQMYSGAALPADQIAVIAIPRPEIPGLFSTMPMGWIEVRAVDGQPVPMNEGHPPEIHLLPGQRRLTLRYLYSAGGGGLLGALVETAMVEGLTKRFERDLLLDAQAGHNYVIRFEVRRPGMFAPVTQWTVDYWIEDLATGAVVAGARS